MIIRLLFIFQFVVGFIITIDAQQLCDGNLGSNIFERGDFGSGPDAVLQSDPGIAPGYIYNNVGPPNDGLYTLTSTTGAFPFLFPGWMVIEESSTNPDGYMMVVNATYEPGLFYEELVTGLCENTLYEFSTEIINVVASGFPGYILPNVSFDIDGREVFSTGDIQQTEQWTKYGFTFSTAPGQTELLLALRNNAPGGNGNDLAIDNISFQACGPNAFVTADQNIFLCEDENSPTEVRADLGDFDQVIQWQTSRDSTTWNDMLNMPGSDFIIHDNFQIGTYYYRYLSAGTQTELQNERCRIISDVLRVEVLALNYTVTDTICAGEQYQFGNQSLNSAGNYFNEFISSKGCDSLVDLQLVVLAQEEITLDTMITDPSCYLFEDGMIEVNNIDGPYPPYDYIITMTGSGTGNPGTGSGTGIPSMMGLGAGDYSIFVSNGFGCYQGFSVTLEEPEEFILDLPEDTTIFLGEALDVMLSSNQEITNLNWAQEDIDVCEACMDFSFVPIETNYYNATAYNEDGCIAEDGFTVTVRSRDPELYIPNVFNPNSDRNNNMIVGYRDQIVNDIKSVNIFDRWGNKVHSEESPSRDNIWDGQFNGSDLSPGVYVYVIDVELINGKTFQYTGDVTLLR